MGLWDYGTTQHGGVRKYLELKSPGGAAILAWRDILRHGEMVGTRPERLSTFLKAVAQALTRRLCNHCCKMRKVSAGGTAALQTWLCTMLLSMCTYRSDATQSLCFKHRRLPHHQLQTIYSTSAGPVSSQTRSFVSDWTDEG